MKIMIQSGPRESNVSQIKYFKILYLNHDVFKVSIISITFVFHPIE